MLGLKLLLGFFLLFVFATPTFAQETYFFNEEFNVGRPAGQLDPEKWIVYPNNDGCSTDTVREIAGFLLLRQCFLKPQFPYVVSKNDPFPDANFSISVKFEYIKAASWGNGIELVDKAPDNGAGFTQLFGIGFWEDTSTGLNMRLQFKGNIVYSTTVNRNPHIFKLDKTGTIYKMYLDDQLLFTSPSTRDKVHAIYMGNPSIQAPPLADWSWFRVDYIRVTQTGPAKTTPEPFLDLPWDYSGSGKDFKQIAFNPTSWFDHKYPLQNFPCCSVPIIDYKGETKDKAYKSHSGYDYSGSQGVIKGTPVLASAAGWATFVPESKSGGAGNMIKIDHENGYQTWYEHLDFAELVVNTEGNKIHVDKGQKIGKVGLTGNTTGYHIHLSVFEDLNSNGDFSDDYPFGLTDPLGWDGDYTDPWEEYTRGDKHGAKSYKLFTQLSAPKTQQVPASGGTVTNQEFTLNVPANSSTEPLNIKIENSAFEKASDIIKSIVPSLLLAATTNSGQIINNFNNPLSLVYDYSKADLSNINEDTISFYFLTPQTGIWEKLSSNLDKTNKTVTSKTSHFSQFAVMGELLDSTPPTTTAEITGTKGSGSRYRSDVSVKLLAQDNPGGKGVSYTVYSLDGEHWNEYQNPLEFKNEGSYKIWFLAHDKAGYEEVKKSVEFSIDKTIPEAKIEVSQSDWDLKVSPVSEDQVTITRKPGKKLNEATYILTDPAGNILTLETYDLDSDNKDVFKLYSLKYNSGKAIPVPSNSLTTTFTYQPNPRQIRIINQTFSLKDLAQFTINADAFKNRTILNIIESKKPRKEEKEGIVLLRLKTNKGKLEYSY